MSSCPNCGYPTSSQESTCLECRMALNATPRQTGTLPSVPAEAKNPLTMAIIAGLALVITATIGFFMFTTYQSNQNARQLEIVKLEAENKNKERQREIEKDKLKLEHEKIKLEQEKIKLQLNKPATQAPASLNQNNFSDNGASGDAIRAKADEWRAAWERRDITAVEFMMHNDFQTNAGINKWKWLELRRKEANITTDRSIAWNNVQTNVNGTRATMTAQQRYYDQFTNGKHWSSNQPIRLEFVWTSGDWYLIGASGI